MNHKLSWVCYGYGWLLRLYPSSHRHHFADEMQAVFAQALDDASAHGWTAVLTLCSRELHDLPHTLLTEYWRLFQQWCTIRLLTSEPLHSDLPGVVPVGYGSVPHLLFVVTGRDPRLRRVFDVVIALCGLVIAAPLFLLLPILIKLDSPGPILYCAPRIGKNGQPYILYKFRSMHANHSSLTQDRTTATIPAALRQTRVGRLARCYCLDELPQLVNVLKGEMSILGPRPGTPTE
ncbi:MAG: sugar transferase [Caldilinea sp. CFX5]|nr:sugar transferase [Caldilinea sp. CFX5]